MSNPIAYRIVASIGMRGPQTTTEIARVLDDVPTSSLYRQLTRLRTAGVLRVAGERQARGAVERTYALSARDSAAFSPEQLAAVPTAKLRATLRNFVATMVANMTAFIESRAFARNSSEMSAALVVCKLTDEEYANVKRDVSAAISRYKDSPAERPGVERRYFYLVTLPEGAAQ